MNENKEDLRRFVKAHRIRENARFENAKELARVRKLSTIFPDKPLWLEHILLIMLGVVMYHIVLNLVGVL